MNAQIRSLSGLGFVFVCMGYVYAQEQAPELKQYLEAEGIAERPLKRKIAHLLSIDPNSNEQVKKIEADITALSEQVKKVRDGQLPSLQFPYEEEPIASLEEQREQKERLAVELITASSKERAEFFRGLLATGEALEKGVENLAPETQERTFKFLFGPGARVPNIMKSGLTGEQLGRQFLVRVGFIEGAGHPPQLGSIGPISGHVKVAVILNSETMLVTTAVQTIDASASTITPSLSDSDPVMIAKSSTQAVVVGKEIELKGYFRVADAKTLETLGSRNRTFVLEPFDMEQVKPFLEARAKNPVKSADKLNEPEYVAGEQLRPLRELVQSRSKTKLKSAERRLRQIIEKYPRTYAAEEAAKLLSKIRKGK